MPLLQLEYVLAQKHSSNLEVAGLLIIMTAINRVLLLGGHGKVALQLTPLLLRRGWDVVSVVRNPAHVEDIEALNNGTPGKVEALVASLDDVKSRADADALIARVDPNFVVWSA
ncbi:hypothetical protein KEM52_001378, partial [Ascosphaera acerosa]